MFCFFAFFFFIYPRGTVSWCSSTAKLVEMVEAQHHVELGVGCSGLSVPGPGAKEAVDGAVHL